MIRCRYSRWQLPSPKSRIRIERWLLVLTVGAVGARITIAEAAVRPRASDFGQVWAAARFLLNGVNPYDAIGPQGPFTFGFPLFYPLTAVVTALPLAWLPAVWADALFMGFSTAGLAWALTRRTTRNPQLLVFVSFAILTAVGNVQWSPLMTAAALIPSFGFLLACKPSLAVPLLAAFPSSRSLLGALGFTMATIIIWPWWFASWVSALRHGTHFVAPITLWGGPLVLLALSKWRLPEARLLIGLACIPHTPVLYESIPLFLVVRRWTEGVVLTLLTSLVWYLQDWSSRPDPTFAAWIAASAQWQVLLLYLPCLVMILMRPNVETSGTAVIDTPGARRDEVTCLHLFWHRGDASRSGHLVTGRSGHKQFSLPSSFGSSPRS
jgi:hypothetical protein